MSLTKEDLQAIGDLIAASEERTGKEMTHQLNLMIEQYFDPRFKALSENQGIIIEKLRRFDELDEVEEMLDAHYAALKAHGRRIRALEQKAV